MKFLSRAIWVTSLKSLVKLLCPLWESLHTPMIKITYTSTHMLYFYTWKIASISIHTSTNKTPCCTMFISLQRYHHDVWAIQKEIKDAYPKKVCDTPTRCVKKREREKKYSPYQKHYKGKRIHIKEFHPPSTKNIHTFAHLDQGLWLVSPLDPVFYLGKCEQRVAFTSSIPTDPPKRAIRSRMEKQRHIKRPWWGMKHIWAIREITRGTTIFLFKNL